MNTKRFAVLAALAALAGCGSHPPAQRAYAVSETKAWPKEGPTAAQSARIRELMRNIRREAP